MVITKARIQVTVEVPALQCDNCNTIAHLPEHADPSSLAGWQRDCLNADIPIGWLVIRINRNPQNKESAGVYHFCSERCTNKRMLF